MFLKLEEVQALKEIEVLIRYAQMNKTVRKLETLIRSADQTVIRLYQLAEELDDAGFVKISKSCLINLHMLSCIRPLINSRMEAALSNGEKVNITRKYVSAIRKKLQEV